MIRKLTVALVFVGAFGSQFASAVGLGELTLKSTLNQKLEAEIKLLNVGDLSKNELLPNLASHEEFARAGVERIFFLTGMKFDVRLSKSGDAYIKLTTDNIVREPFLNFLVELHWPSGRILREYTVLLDPPIFSESPASMVSQAEASTSGPDSPPPSSKKKTEKNVNRPTYASAKPSATSSYRTRSESEEGRVRVKKNDTLWGIAKENRPGDEVTIRQTMLAIQRHNPQAFIRNNINLLKAGQVLKIPNVDQILALSSTEVQEEIERQNEAWRSNRTIDATQEDDVVIDEADQAAADYSSQGQLKLLTDDTSKLSQDLAANASGASLEGEDDNTEVTPQLGGVSALSANSNNNLDEGFSDNSSPVDEDLQGQIENLKRLLTLKDQQLALLQAKTSDNNSKNGTATLGVAGGGDSELSVPNTTEELAIQEEKVESKKTDVANSKPDQGIIATLLDNPIYIGLVILAVLVGLIILGAISRRRNEETEYPQDLQEAIHGNGQNDVQLPEDLANELEEDKTVEPAASPRQTEKDVANLQKDTEIRKLLEEADIYIAYGRYERALEILQPAVNKNPTIPSLRLKLVEIFLATGDVAKLSQQEADLLAIGDDEALATLEELKAERSMIADANSGEVAEEGIAVDGSVSADENDKPADLDEGVEFTLDEVASDKDAEAPEEALDSAADDMDFLGDTDEAATKLELGRAYIDMADKDAAMDILNEVVEDGNEEQKEEAKRLLKSIA
ncbi:MAG: LysM peptidoglycan-binding domain-containing protein [Pseudomonadales bacterium]|nr:LysM peptidoglycan-binding domain-containing protein [Pseudomonadales bacterium]